VTAHEQEFAEFAEASAPRLRRAAFLLCGDWHTAEDLAQTALANVLFAVALMVAVRPRQPGT
jgi:DNA-directed RNA polymerase specialized sigma24 family protein